MREVGGRSRDTYLGVKDVLAHGCCVCIWMGMEGGTCSFVFAMWLCRTSNFEKFRLPFSLSTTLMKNAVSAVVSKL